LQFNRPTEGSAAATLTRRPTSNITHKTWPQDWTEKHR
jgi:hypothetical protein